MHLFCPSFLLMIKTAPSLGWHIDGHTHTLTHTHTIHTNTRTHKHTHTDTHTHTHTRQPFTLAGCHFCEKLHVKLFSCPWSNPKISSYPWKAPVIIFKNFTREVFFLPVIISQKIAREAKFSTWTFSKPKCPRVSFRFTGKKINTAITRVSQILMYNLKSHSYIISITSNW